MGLCLHDFAIEPCSFHLNCVPGCPDYLRRIRKCAGKALSITAKGADRTGFEGGPSTRTSTVIGSGLGRASWNHTTGYPTCVGDWWWYGRYRWRVVIANAARLGIDPEELFVPLPKTDRSLPITGHNSAWAVTGDLWFMTNLPALKEAKLVNFLVGHNDATVCNSTAIVSSITLVKASCPQPK